MSGAPQRRRLAAGLVSLTVVLAAVGILIGAGGGGAEDPGAFRTADVPARGAIPIRIMRTRGGRRVPAGFLGFSFEFQGVRAYTGPDPRRINPVLVQLMRNLTPGQRPALRIGGDSTDVSWLPGAGVKPPAYVSYRLTRSWLATTGALARLLNARMTMGLNLGANHPALAAAEAGAFRQAVGPARLEAFEIGNEPDLYARIPLIKSRAGKPLTFRRRGFGYSQFRDQFAAETTATEAAAGPVPLSGPAQAVGPTPDAGSWVGSMDGFLAGQPRLHTFTIHRYPLRNCYVARSSRQYPTVPHLLSSYATKSLAAGLRRWIGIAHAHHRLVRLDELNSVACRGRAGISDAFASALWIPDALFSLLQAGVDGVNMHTLPDAAYELFHFTSAASGWQGYAQPIYYGLQLFAQAAPPGARLMGVAGLGRTSSLSVWATRAPDGTVRVVLVNKGPRRRRVVSLRLPSGTARQGTVERLSARSVYARRGVTLGGRGFGSHTSTGVLPAPQLQGLTAHAGRYTMAVPAGSAALVTFAGRG